MLPNGTLPFSDQTRPCEIRLEEARWPEGLQCPRCRSRQVHSFWGESRSAVKRFRYECSVCRYQYSVTAGTLFHGSRLPLCKWFRAVQLTHISRRPPTAAQLQLRLKTTYKTAWHMLYQFRSASLEDSAFLRRLWDDLNRSPVSCADCICASEQPSRGPDGRRCNGR
jgi:transposase-like protein